MIEKRLIATTAILLVLAIDASRCWPLPKNVCTSPFKLQVTTKPTTVVGTGTPISCTQSALEAALLIGGTITFNCGTQPVTIPITSEMQVSKVDNTIIDGAGLITLDGTGSTRILRFDRGDFRYPTPILTVQRLRFINARCQDNDGGCAIFQKNGGTTIAMNCSFENNTGPVVGQDTAGGAIWTIGGGDTTVVGSVFIGNKCSNGGGLGILGSGLIIYNSHFASNQATGNGGNPGNGGNGGAISFDGRGRNNTICGTRFTKNQGNKYGGAFFRVSYNGNETNNFDNCLVDSNFISVDGGGLAGGLYIQGGTASIRNTTIANNSATGAGGLFLADEKAITITNVNLLANRAYTSLGGAVFCSAPVSGVFSGLTVANSSAGAFSAAFTFCTGTITLTNSIIANSTAGNPWSANACNSPMNDGKGVVQSPINKQKPATGADAPCTNGTRPIDGVAVMLDRATWKIKVIGASAAYLGPDVVPGL